jgi:SAM-dependent methyltransferase
MTVFDNYAKYYDLFYDDKDYDQESRYIQSLMKQYAPKRQLILELGCGTGKHSQLLASSGYRVDGIDLSPGMIKAAVDGRRHLPPRIAARLDYVLGDVRHYRSDRQYDVALSLFHILSYQTTNQDLIDTLQTVTSQLKPGGIFIFDCWYGPAVLALRPAVRVKERETATERVIRIATPVEHPNQNQVDVNYRLLITNKKTTKCREMNETHRMRYLFQPEIEFLLKQAGLKLLRSEEWLTGNEPSDQTWGVCFVAEKI